MLERYDKGVEGSGMKSRLYFLSLTASIFIALAGCTSVTATASLIPTELSIEEHALSQRPEAEYTQLYFADSTPDDILVKHEEERSKSFTFMDASCTVDNHFGICATLGADKLMAWDEYGSGLFGSGKVTLARNDSSIYQIAVGDSSPIGSLRGLWTYDSHWALETAYVTNHQKGNEIDSEAVGQISVDGQLLNKQLNFQEAFGFQTMHGKPFYFFKQDNKIGISYAGVEVPLGYAEVLHYGCCSAATLNPKVAQNMVAFFARKGSRWYYTEIGVFGSPSP